MKLLRLASIGAGLTGIFSFALAGPGFLGTKTAVGSTVDSGSMGAAQGPVGFLPALQMIGALLAVLALVKWGLPMVAKKFGAQGFKRSSGAIRIEEMVPFGASQIGLVSVKDKTFLIGSTSTAVAMLADLTEVRAAKESHVTFHEMLESETGVSPTLATEADPLRDLAGQLDRLKRLGL